MSGKGSHGAMIPWNLNGANAHLLLIAFAIMGIPGEAQTPQGKHRGPRPSSLDAGRPKPIQLNLPNGNGFSFVVFSPDNRVVVHDFCPHVTPRNPLPQTENATVGCDAATGKELFRFKGDKYHYIVGAVFSPDGTKLAVSMMNSTISLWDVKNRRPLHLFGSQGGGNVKDFGFTGGRFSPDSKILVARAARGLVLWDTASYEECNVCGNQAFGDVCAFALAADAKTVVTEYHLDVPPAEGEVRGKHEGKQEITAAIWSFPDGKYLGRVGEVTKWHYRKADVYMPGRKLDELGLRTGEFRARLWSGNHYFFLPRYEANSYLTISSTPRTIRLCDATSGKVLQCLRDFENGAVLSVALSLDGNRLAATGQVEMGKSVRRLVLWDVSHFNRACWREAVDLKANQLENFWNDLANPSLPTAHRAMRAFVNTPAQAVTFLKGRLRPVAKECDVPKVIRQLDSNDFKIRRKAAKELEAVGAVALSGLEKALRSRPSVEFRLRAERLLTKLQKQPIPREELRGLRAIDVLEHIGTPEARAVLDTMGKGASSSGQTQEARAALRRLERKSREGK